MISVSQVYFLLNEEEHMILIIQKFYEKGADFNAVDDENKTAFKIAKEWKHRKIAKLIRKLSKSQK